MKSFIKVFKWMTGIFAFILFLVFIDDSGTSFKKHLKAIRSYATGDEIRLRFTPDGWKKEK